MAKKKKPETPAEETPAEETPAEETPAEEVAAEHAVPSEEASEIASVVEDAPLEALQEAEETPAPVTSAEETPAAGVDQPAGEKAEGPPGIAEEMAAEHAVPSEEASEIASVVEDAPLEALQEAEEIKAEESEKEPAAVEAAAGRPAGERAEEDEDGQEPASRAKPSVPGAHLEVDIVPEGADPLGRTEAYEDPYAIEDEVEQAEDSDGKDDDEEDEVLSEPISTAAIDLAAGARYRATGKRKTAIARVTLRPGSGTYLVNGRVLEEHFPRVTLQRNIRQPLETVGYQERMDVVARLHGGGISAQAGALRHGVSRALLEADPNLRGELKRRGFLTRDSRAKERKKAGLKKARKRPQFSKR
jgi:small subunit ribosomal protein S9